MSWQRERSISSTFTSAAAFVLRSAETMAAFTDNLNSVGEATAGIRIAADDGWRQPSAGQQFMSHKA